MIDINLYNNKAFKWYNNEKIYAIGYVIENNKTIKDMELVEYFSNIDTIENLKEKIKNLKGFFSIVIKLQKKIIIISDIIRSFPVFIKIQKDIIIISDDINYFKNKLINEDSVEEFLATGYVVGEKTLYKEIIQLQNAEIIDINLTTFSISKSKYFQFKYNVNRENKEEYLIEQLDELYDNAIKDLITFLNGRKAIIPLSGGHDSRLIAYYLKKNNYTNVVTYTYGRKNNPEAIISKKVANYLNFEWHFIEYKNSNMQKKYYDEKQYSNMADYCARGYSTTHIQEWEAIEYLLHNNIIKKGDVVIPGFSGDFIAGSHINNEMIQDKARTYEEIKNYIIKINYRLYNWKANDKYNKRQKIFCNIINNYMQNIENKNEVNSEIFNNLIERFDFEERQVKFISNSVRTYDINGLQWYMPLWDKKILNFWLTIPLDERAERKIYNKFTDSVYGDLMKYAPIVKEVDKKVYKNKMCRLFQKTIRMYTYYFKHSLNYYGYIKFRDYLKLCIQYGTGGYYFMFSHKYIKYIKLKEEKNEN